MTTVGQAGRESFGCELVFSITISVGEVFPSARPLITAN